ncbi:GAF domain-containing protein [Synechococcales cyanobacterium C]|uniref:Circadian input-output histidine kinase CikA n=1 Tax=Petrachloros mirabilis ULC683 TaxID=2781853 RepID=A0A8K2A871_9CYAN|nr:ATP-binding protein [Petrachloros mirabilis]NCJ07699.1 GAF domain-containing protein [Petrachloros mirabilis ULC683]
MSSSAVTTLVRPLSISTFETLRSLLAQTAQDLPRASVHLTETDLPVRPPSPLVFTVVVSKRFSALLHGTSDGVNPTLQATLTFELQHIHDFLDSLAAQYPESPKLDQALGAMGNRANDTHLQSQITLRLVELLATPSDVPEALPTPASCQPMVDAALHEQIAQEHLLNQVTTQIRQSLDLSLILNTAIEQARIFLEVDRVVIYQLLDTPAETDLDAHDTQVMGSVTYESLTSPDLPSSLHYQEQRCWQQNHPCLQKYLQGKPLAIADIEQGGVHSQCLFNFLKAMQVRAQLIMPILVQSRLWGFLIAHQCAIPRTWQDREQHLMEHIAEHLAIAIYQSQLYQQLQQQKQTLEDQVMQRTQELQSALLVTQSAHRAKSDFLATMSHELKTPLTCVIGMSATLLRWSLGPLTEKQRSYLQTIHDSGEHLLELINDILEFSHAEAGKATLNLVEFSILSLAKQCLQMLRDKALANQITLKTSFDIPAQRDRFLADPRRVKQILLNLLSNAVKFTPPGGQVTLRLWMESHTVVFQVEDTGIGISTSQQSLLFQRFQQLDSSYRRNYEGTGLGLALTKQLVELHQGWIEVTSEEGKGSIFTVKIPHQARSEVAPSSLPVLASTGTLQSAGRIMLVEDEEESASMVCDMLTAAGYHVVWLVDGAAALEQIRFVQPIAMIVNLETPHIAQLNLVQRVRSQTERRPIKILAFAGVVVESEDCALMDWGADAILPKPVRPEDLIYTIEALLGNRARKPLEADSLGTLER